MTGSATWMGGGLRTVVLAAVAVGTLRTGGTAQDEPVPFRFRDLTVLSGGTLDFGNPKSSVGMSSGGFVDVDGDGWDDIVTLTGAGEPCGYFLNRDDGQGGRTFVPAPPGNGLDDGPAFERDGVALAAGDVDADGDIDLFVGASWNPSLPSGVNLLLLNDGTGRFTDRAVELGLWDGDNTTGGAAFFDMDLDGDLDLVTANSNFEVVDKYGDGKPHLWRNLLAETGELGFVDEAIERGVTPTGVACWAIITPDYDDDGDFDVLVTYDGGGVAQLFQNDGTGYFVEVTEQVGSGPGDDGDPSTFGDETKAAMGAAAVDFDNDGDLDIYVTNILHNPMYVNHGDGTFHMAEASLGIDHVTTTWGCTFVDFDLDGILDAYVAGGALANIKRKDFAKSLFLQGMPGFTYRDVWVDCGFRRDVPLNREMGTAAADFDHDGRADLLVVRGEWDGAPPYLYRNETDVQGRHWLGIRPHGDGVRSNRTGIGTRVRVFPRDADGAVIEEACQTHEWASGDSRSSMSGLTRIFGLGDRAVTADVEVVWPRAGPRAERTNRFTDVPIDRIVEFADEVSPHWRLEPGVTVEVGCGRTTRVPLAGSGPGVQQAACTLESGHALATLGPFVEGDWTLDLSPGVVQQPEVVAFRIRAEVPGTPGTRSFQTVHLTVQPAPVVTLVEVQRRGRRIVVTGHNLPAENAEVRVDGEVLTRIRPRRKGRELDGDATRIVVRAPGYYRTRFAGREHVYEVVDLDTGLSSGPVHVPAR